MRTFVDMNASCCHNGFGEANVTFYTKTSSMAVYPKLEHVPKVPKKKLVCVCGERERGFIRTGACVRRWDERYARTKRDFGAILHRFTTRHSCKSNFLFFYPLSHIASPINSLEFCARAKF